ERRPGTEAEVSVVPQIAIIDPYQPDMFDRAGVPANLHARVDRELPDVLRIDEVVPIEGRQIGLQARAVDGLKVIVVARQLEVLLEGEMPVEALTEIVADPPLMPVEPVVSRLARVEPDRDVAVGI